MKTLKYPLLLAFAGIVSLHGSAERGEFVAISSTASASYIRPLNTSGRPTPATYIFAEGRRFESTTVDNRLARTPMDDILRTLAPSLAKQNFFPASKPSSADLIIVVHWGSTRVYEDPQKDTRFDAINAAVSDYNASISLNGHADVGTLNDIAGDIEAGANATEQAIARNAVLLGYAQTLQRYHNSASMLREGENTLRSELNEERYFVVLMAYDYSEYKAKRPRLLWVTRLSMRSAGTNFTEALPILSEAGSKVYGQELGVLGRVRGSMHSGEVQLGELRSLGPAEGQTNK